MKIKLSAIIIILIMIVSACSPKTEETPISQEPIIEQPAEGGEITVGTDLSDLRNDAIGYSIPESAIYNIDSILYRSLFKYNDQLQLSPDIASTLNIDEINKIIEIKLKDNVKFEDGKPITVEDILYSINMYSSGTYNGKWKEYTYNIQGTDQYRIGQSDTISGITIALEENSISLSYNELSAKDLQLLTAPILSKGQLEGKSIDEIKELSQNGKLLASGPYKIEAQSDTEWILARNEAYEETVYLDKIKFLDYRETDSYDLVFNIPQQEENKEENKEMLTLNGQGYQYLGINLNTAELQDASTRRAIALGLDYQLIIDNIYQGYASQPKSPIHPKSWAYTDVDVDNETNTEEAKNLLAGKKLTFTLAYEDTPFFNDLAKQIATQLGEIGIDINLNPIAKEQYISKLFYTGEFDLFIASWHYELDPFLENEKWLAKNDVLQGGYNVSHIKDATSDEFLVNGESTLDFDRRKVIYKEWQSYFMDQYYYIPLASPKLILVKDNKLNLEINNSLTPYFNIQNWWLSQ